jgi:hypothetical protein
MSIRSLSVGVNWSAVDAPGVAGAKVDGVAAAWEGAVAVSEVLGRVELFKRLDMVSVWYFVMMLWKSEENQ